MITQELKKLVVDEALALRKYCTDEEKDRLDYEGIIPTKSSFCIYGQITGDCFSGRATELLNKCTKAYSGSIRQIKLLKKPEKFCSENRVCGISTPNNRYSPIEFYIAQEGANIEDLVKLIKS